MPLLPRIGGNSGSYVVHDTHTLEVQWQVTDGRRLTLYAHLSETACVRAPSVHGRVLWHEGHGARGTLGPWTVVWTLGEPIKA